MGTLQGCSCMLTRPYNYLEHDYLLMTSQRTSGRIVKGYDHWVFWASSKTGGERGIELSTRAQSEGAFAVILHLNQPTQFYFCFQTSPSHEDAPFIHRQQCTLFILANPDSEECHLAFQMLLFNFTACLRNCEHGPPFLKLVLSCRDESLPEPICTDTILTTRTSEDPTKSTLALPHLFISRPSMWVWNVNRTESTVPSPKLPPHWR